MTIKHYLNSIEKQSKQVDSAFKDFKSLSINEKNFNQEIELNKEYNFKIPKKLLILTGMMFTIATAIILATLVIMKK